MSKFDALFDESKQNQTEVTEQVEETPVQETTEQVENEESEQAENQSEETTTEATTEEEPQEGEKKHWRERYAETDDYKAKVKKQDESALMAKLKEIEEIEKDEAYQLIKTARAQGKNPIDVIKELAIDNVSALSPKDLFMKDLEKYKDSLTEEERAEEIEKFESKSKLEQIKATEGIKAELTKQREEALTPFKAQPKQEPKLDPETQAKVNKFDADFDNRLNLLDGKTINGVKFTPAVLKKIEDTIANGHISPELFMDENGNFDADEAIDLAVFKHYRVPYINGLKGESKSEGFKEALKQKHNVGSGKVRTTGMPDATDSKAKKKAEIDSMFK